MLHSLSTPFVSDTKSKETDDDRASYAEMTDKPTAPTQSVKSHESSMMGVTVQAGKLFYLLNTGGITNNERENFSLFLGINPDDLGRTGACCFQLLHMSAKNMDASLASCFAIGCPCFPLKPCTWACDAMCLFTLKTTNITEMMIFYKIHEDNYPRNTQHIDNAIRLYFRDSLGFGESIQYSGTVYTAAQKENLVHSIRKNNWFWLGQNLARVLQVGSIKYETLFPVPLYVSARHRLSYCCFDTCYGGSYSMAHNIVNYMEDYMVPADLLQATIDNFDEKWSEYLNKTLAEALVEGAGIETRSMKIKR